MSDKVLARLTGCLLCVCILTCAVSLAMGSNPWVPALAAWIGTYSFMVYMAVRGNKQ